MSGKFGKAMIVSPTFAEYELGLRAAGDTEIIYHIIPADDDFSFNSAITFGILKHQPDVVFIDGLRDLLASINDEESITNILNDFGSLAEERNINIWMALHQNPSRKNDDDDAKMRGWAGTEYGNKVSDTLVSIKIKKPEGVTFVVKQQGHGRLDVRDY